MAFESYDKEFSIPAQHRLRVTEDVLGADVDALLGVLQPSGDRDPKVQVWIDSHVESTNPGLRERILEILGSPSSPVDLVTPPQTIVGGEECKNDPAVIDRLLRSFHEANLDRRSYVVVIGGGAVLDAVGYAATIAHRGIRLVRLPTTTLAQADSGVGVKSAVNWFDKKNWIGAFAVPWAVINDARLLESLSDRDFRCGFSEAVKVSLLKDPKAFHYLCENAQRIARRDMAAALPAIGSAVRLHLEHITEGGDPFESREARPLDFGHWSAHRLEALSDFRIRHGEAVAIGVAIDCVYSAMKHGLPTNRMHQVLTCLMHLQLPIADPLLEHPDALLAGFEEFRQHLGGRLTVTMLKDVGNPIDVHDVDLAAVRHSIDTVLAASTAASPE